MDIKDLEVYKLAREISKDSWIIYNRLGQQVKIVLGNQFIRATDSIGANIAEGFGRFHYLDRNKFNYNARGSLLESMHWLDSLYERDFATGKEYQDLIVKLEKLKVKLNNYIESTKKLGNRKASSKSN